MKFIDLHTHSTYSDGTYTPEELLRYGKEKGLAAIALTDHDTVSGITEALYGAEKYGMELVRGIEISVRHQGTEIHILGLLIDHESPGLLQFLDRMQENRELRNLEMVARMQQHKLNITLDELADIAGNPAIITRPHFANLLVKKGYAKNIGEAFRNYLLEGCKTYVPRKFLPPKDAIEAIKAAGGISVMAHPLQYCFSITALESTLAVFKSWGLDAIEAVYATHTEKDEKFYKAIAAKFGLLVTGGSDFHGSNKPGLDLGCGFGNLAIPYALLADLKSYHAAR